MQHNKLIHTPIRCPKSKPIINKNHQHSSCYKFAVTLQVSDLSDKMKKKISEKAMLNSIPGIEEMESILDIQYNQVGKLLHMPEVLSPDFNEILTGCTIGTRKNNLYNIQYINFLLAQFHFEGDNQTKIL